MSFLSENANFIAYIICALIGGITHYLKKYLRGETKVKINQWFGGSNLTATVYTFIVFFFVVIGTLSTGVVSIDTSIWVVLYTGFMSGFAIDAGVNSDGKQLASDVINLSDNVSNIEQAKQNRLDKKLNKLDENNEDDLLSSKKNKKGTKV